MIGDQVAEGIVNWALGIECQCQRILVFPSAPETRDARDSNRHSSRGKGRWRRDRRCHRSVGIGARVVTRRRGLVRRERSHRIRAGGRGAYGIRSRHSPTTFVAEHMGSHEGQVNT